MTEKEVIQVAKEQKKDQPDIIEMYGVKARVVTVPVGLIQDALAKIKQPDVPTWFNEDKGRDEENPNHPDYLRDIDEYREKRGLVTTDTLCLFGIDIEDGWPPGDTKWLRRLKLMHKRDSLDLEWVDWDDEIDLEFLFKRYVLGTSSVIARISAKTGVTQEGIAQAKDGFPGNEK